MIGYNIAMSIKRQIFDDELGNTDSCIGAAKQQEASVATPTLVRGLLCLRHPDSRIWATPFGSNVVVSSKLGNTDS